MGLTPTYQLPYPELTDPADVPADMRELADRLDLVIGGQIVSSLPGSPVDGQQIYYLASATNGIVWQLRYRAAATGLYKWEYVGGGALRAGIVTDETFALSGAMVDATTPGPSLTLPLAGDYSYQMSANMYSAGQTAAARIGVGLSLAAATPAPPDLGYSYVTGGLVVSVARQGVLVAQPAGRVLKVQYEITAAAGGTPHTRWRELYVEPVRVG